MKAAAILLSAAFVMTTAAPAHAQLGALGKIKKGADTAVKAKEDVDKMHVDEKEERELGENVSERLRQRFGVVQDRELTKYVSLVGAVVAQQSSRPDAGQEDHDVELSPNQGIGEGERLGVRLERHLAHGRRLDRAPTVRRDE